MYSRKVIFMRICIVSHYDVIRRNTGGDVRTYYLAESLAAQGNKVCVVIPGGHEVCELGNGILVKGVSGVLPYSLLRFFSIILGVERVSSLYLYDVSFLLRLLPTVYESDIVQLDTPVPGAFFMAFMLAKLLRRIVVVDSHDAFQALRTEYSNAVRRVLELPMEKLTYRFATVILAVSDTDKKLLARYGVHQTKIVVIPNGVDTVGFAPTVDAQNIKDRYDLNNSSTVVFVGNMEYPPNQQAVDLIATKIAPETLSKIENVKFIMVGRKPQRLPSSSSLIFTGVVQDVAQYLAASDVAIAPLLQGSGTRLKILEYLSCGLPVISTSIGIEGLEVRNAVNVLIEDDMDEFCARIVELLRNRRLRTSLGDSGRELVVRKYDWRAIGKKLNATFHVKLQQASAY